MSRTPLASKIAVPYARALYDYSVEQNVMHKITADFQNLDVENGFETEKFIQSFTSKGQTTSPREKIFISEHLDKFFKVLVKRNRLNLVSEIGKNYLELVYKSASVKMVEVSTAFPFTTVQKLNLIKKLKELTIRFNRAIATFRTKQQRLFDELKLKIVLTVLTRSVLKAKQTFGTKQDHAKKRSSALINETIQKIEGDLFNE